jgi:hypothetical protein
MKIKVEVLSGKVVGMDRTAWGIAFIDNAEFIFDLYTDNGMTSIYIGGKSLESTEDEFNGVDGFILYEAILQATVEAGFELQN